MRFVSTLCRPSSQRYFPLRCPQPALEFPDILLDDAGRETGGVKVQGSEMDL